MRRPIIRPWTDEEVKVLKALVAKGASPVKAAAALKRKMESVKAKARIIGTPFLAHREGRKSWTEEPVKQNDVPPWRR